MTRHAKNKARWLEMTIAEAEWLIENPMRIEVDRDGKPKYYGNFRGLSVCLIVALDAPDLIVTIYKEP
jgi:hypothetical protein